MALKIRMPASESDRLSLFSPFFASWRLVESKQVGDG